MPDYSAQLAEVIKALNGIQSALLSQHSVSLIAIIATAATVVAAFASAWAARAAHIAAKNVENIARREILRNLFQVAYDVISESEQAKSLVEEIKRQVADLKAHSGNQSIDTRKVESHHQEIVPFHEEAESLVNQRAELKDATEEDLAQALSKFDGYLSKARRVRNDLERQAEAYAAANAAFFSKAINSIR